MKLVVPAAALAVLASAAPLATASTTRADVPAPTATLPGSVLPSVAHSTVVGETPPAAAVHVSLVLRPSHPGLLATLAAQSSGRPGLSQAMINRLFRPSPAVRSQVAAYMAARGFHATGTGLLAMSFTGNAVQAERAFGVSLQRYHLRSGISYRAPSGAIHLPPALARRVMEVDGLSTLPLMQPAGLRRSKSHLTSRISPGPPCSNATGVAGSNGLLPAQLADPAAYDSQPLLTGNSDGTGENVALVEFSNYANGDQQQYQNCFALHVPVARVSIDGGNTKTNGGDEVALDQEVLVGQAPDLDHIWTFVAPGSDSMAGMIDSILARRSTEHTTIISDSWGICEAAEFPSSAAATDKELQITAVAGVSFFAASGDDGSSDCARFGLANLFVDDPASQPYATGVGGTNLNPGVSETVWGGHGSGQGGGGGGVSQDFLKPSWQKGPGVIRSGLSSKTKCGGKTHYCREVPDVAFDADPNTGYVIFCTTASCVGLGGWISGIGGTSAAAPLMAAFTADANEFSRANGGTRLGYANPFLYHEFAVDPAMFNDVTVGNNSILGAGHTTYRAAAGYDMATGLGSIDVNNMATHLAGYTRSAVKVHGTRLTGTASPNPRPFGGNSTLSGKLTDKTSHIVLGGRFLVIEGFLYHSNTPSFFVLHTGRKGGWSFKATHARVPRRFRWRIVYFGEQGHRPAITPYKILATAK